MLTVPIEKQCILVKRHAVEHRQRGHLAWREENSAEKFLRIERTKNKTNHSRRLAFNFRAKNRDVNEKTRSAASSVGITQ